MKAAIPEGELVRFSEFLAERTGLYFPPERWQELQQGIMAASVEFGFEDAASCVQALMAEPLTRQRKEILASHLTVGETYFFRERPLFDELADRILPGLILSRREGGRRLRLWSAGCCTGEEPYSLAILLHRLIPDIASWTVTILASDINPRFLQKAQAGEFRQWSFRDSPDWLAEHYFKKTRDGHYAILPEIRKMVTFAPLNLVEDAYPSLLSDTNAMDLILCRNVVMYFTPEQGRQVIRKLGDSLVEGGWLGVSPSEVSLVGADRLVSASLPDVTLFRRGARAGMTPPVTAGEDIRKEKSTRADATPAKEFGVKAQALANEGRLEEALVWCEKAIVAKRFDASLHYLRAAILHEQGLLGEAVQSFHRAIYLQPDYVLAHFALGNVARQERKHKDASKHYRTVLRILRDSPPDHIVPESEGLTVARLQEIVTALLETERAA